MERLSLMLRLEWHLDHLERELHKLLNRLYKTNLTTNPEALDVITRKAIDGQDVDTALLLSSVEGLFVV